MVGIPKKYWGFRGAVNTGSKIFIYINTEKKDFTLQSSNAVLNSSRIVIPFHPLGQWLASNMM